MAALMINGVSRSAGKSVLTTTFARAFARRGADVESVATGPVVPALSARHGFVAGPVLGMSVHGLFENAAAVAALVGRVPPRTLEVAFDDLADAVEEHLNASLLLREAGVG
jgi:cobyric acid synthase